MSEIRVDSAPDGVEDQVGEDLRLALLIATQGAHRLMQMFTNASRQREQQSREATQRFQAEMQAHQAMAIAVTRDAGTERWWQESSPAQVAHAWEVARVWEGRDPELSARATAMREGLADRYGVADPDSLTVRDLVAAQRDERAGQVASPLDQAGWEAREFGRYADELARQREALTSDTRWSEGLRVHGEPRQFVTGEDSTTVHDRQEWGEARAEGLAGLEREARLGQRHATDRADRLRGHGAAPTSGKEWANVWDTAERREALRGRLQSAGVPADAAQARLLTDRAQGTPPSAAANRPTTAPLRRASTAQHQHVQQRRTR